MAKEWINASEKSHLLLVNGTYQAPLSFFTKEPMVWAIGMQLAPQKLVASLIKIRQTS